MSHFFVLVKEDDIAPTGGLIVFPGALCPVFVAGDLATLQRQTKPRAAARVVALPRISPGPGR